LQQTGQRVAHGGGAHGSAVAVKALVLGDHTVPTGLSALPPVGPATPVTATVNCTGAWRIAPAAMARATGSLTAPWASISSAGTPSSSVLAALE